MPFGQVGKSFIQEMANLFQVYGENSSLECIALEACFLMQMLLLQKPSKTSKAKDHVTCLQRHLVSCKKGEIKVLVGEGRCIQSHLPTTDTRRSPEAVSRAFSKMMFLGNVHGALNLLLQNTSSLPLKLEDVIQTKEGTTESVLNILESLHPKGKPLANEALLSSTLSNALRQILSSLKPLMGT